MAADLTLEASVRPRDVVVAAGAWLGERLGEDGFGWIASGTRLQRSVGPLVHQVDIQSSKHNRTGKLIKVSTMLNVREPALAAWRRAHPELVIDDNDVVCGHLLGYASGRANGHLYGDPDDGDIDLTDPAHREARLHTFVTMFRNSILPWFVEASDPELIVESRARDYTNDCVSLVEWLASRDRPDLIRRYADRYLRRNVSWAAEPFAEGVAVARAGQRVPGRWMVNTATALGWSVATLTGAGT